MWNLLSFLQGRVIRVYLRAAFELEIKQIFLKARGAILVIIRLEFGGEALFLLAHTGSVPVLGALALPPVVLSARDVRRGAAAVLEVG